MIRVHIQAKGLQALQKKLENMTGRGSTRAVEDMRLAAVTGNRRDRLEAHDRYGRRLPPRKHPRSDGARGPVMVPHSTGSRAISGFFARKTRRRSGWEIVCGWNGAHWLVFHKLGTVRGAPRRDLMGFSPRTHARMRAIFRAWVAGEYN
jgi:hypothetical protein